MTSTRQSDEVFQKKLGTQPQWQPILTQRSLSTEGFGPVWFSALWEQTRALGKLSANWDGYGASPPSSATVTRRS